MTSFNYFRCKVFKCDSRRNLPIRFQITIYQPKIILVMQCQGVIRIHSQSPYEHLDANTIEWLNQLKQLWPLWKKNAAISDMLFKFFSRSENPFKSALQIMFSCGDFYTGKQNSLAYHIMENFCNWLKCQNIPKIPTDIKLDAVNLITRQKNYALIKLVVEIYRMSEDKEIFVEPIKQLCRSKKYKEACQLASLLNLHECFGIEEFLVPLVFQDKYVIAEQFLEGSKKHQIDLAVFLDDLIGKKSVLNEAQAIIVYLNILDARLRGLSYKPLSKLLTRIIKTFDLPQTTCPNLTQKKGKGILKFLFHKRYIEKSIGGESWNEMVLEAIGDDETLQVELIENVTLFGDIREALMWAEKFGTPEELWPLKLQEFNRREKSKSSNSFENTNMEENWDDLSGATPPLKFHKLPIEESQIKLIDTASSFCNFIIDLTNETSIIGIDAEWKPSFGFKNCDLALIQIAAFHVVYILDVITLSTAAPLILWERFANVFFEHPNILKLGFGINTDIIIMKEMFRKLHGIKTGSDVGFLDLSALWKTLVQDYKFVFPCRSISKPSENLNCLIEMCLGESLDKSDQFSNWENRPLRKSQIVYAAIDAYCLLEAYNVIVKECESQNIPISDIIDETIYDTTTKKTRKKKAGKAIRASERISENE